jgi:hypothetical protein
VERRYLLDGIAVDRSSGNTPNTSHSLPPDVDIIAWIGFNLHPAERNRCHEESSTMVQVGTPPNVRSASEVVRIHWRPTTLRYGKLWTARGCAV